jgi:Fe-S cluster assembly protein SufD
MTLVKPEAAPYLDLARSRGTAAEPAFLAELRERAAARFGQTGFPTRRDEAWRFSDLRPLTNEVFDLADPDLVTGASQPYALGEEAIRAVLVNGRLAPELSRMGGLPPGVWLGSLSEAIATRPGLVEPLLDQGEGEGNLPLAALNAALFADGLVLSLEPGAVLDRPLEIVHWGQAPRHSAIHSRHLLLLGARARATVLEIFAGKGNYWQNPVTIVRVGEGADLRHYKLQDEAVGAVHTALARVAIDGHACYDSFVLALGGRLARHEVQSVIEGSHATCALNGAYMARGQQETTIATLVDHAAPCSSTREVIKGVAEQRAHGVFQGKFLVRREAQKTDAHQLNKNLLLSTRAAIDTKPELEIFADDVKCSHGATVGDLDDRALFYLRSRGIEEMEARRMLIEAFAVDALDLVEDAAVRAFLDGHLHRWLRDESGLSC